MSDSTTADPTMTTKEPVKPKTTKISKKPTVDANEVAQIAVKAEKSNFAEPKMTTETTTIQDSAAEKTLKSVESVAAAGTTGISEPVNPLKRKATNDLPSLTVPSVTTLPQEPPVKPQPGTEEWHKWKRLNHKEVEKRRRESINLGINLLKELLPTKDDNKSQIILRAVEYIKRLKENEASNIEKWTLEKLITDQAVNELANSNDKLKLELEKIYREVEHWKKYCKQLQEEKEAKK